MVGTLPVSPLAPKRFPRLAPVAGVQLAAVAAGERYAKRPDLMLATMPAGTTVAGTLTKNRMPGQPVVWCRRLLPKGKARALLVNAGNANVFTGRAGEQVIADAVETVAKQVKCPADEVFVASTGVIGEQIRLEKVLGGIPRAAKRLSSSGLSNPSRCPSLMSWCRILR